jgi:hypothetical protein
MRLTSLATLVFPVMLAATACSDSSNSSLTVRNDSDFEIDQLFVTGTDHASWGPNLLGNQPLLPGDAVSIDVSCGTFDALLVDETGAQCELDSIDLCFADATWVLNNNTCAVFRKQ